ncbi:MAG: hypothetical protein WD845_05770 [Pirellulales bacterium]
MARREQDREDMLAEATALVQRASLRLPEFADPVIVGFRRDRSASFYFGADPVYQFTSGGLLRRAFVDGLIYKAERGRLVSLERQRDSNAVQLVRHELREEEQQSFMAGLRRHLNLLRGALADGQSHVVGQVPANADVIDRVRTWLAEFGDTMCIAISPRSG